MASKRDPAPPGRGPHARVCVLCVRDLRNSASFGQRLEGPVLDGKVHTHECAYVTSGTVSSPGCAYCACMTTGTG